ncbi:MAG: putative Ig domain-containing protein, partial [Rudanella sp.]|nr:putative Ig domain-containing protein [Rudanella sp.]
MVKNLRLTTARLWLCALTLFFVGQFRQHVLAQGTLTLSQPTYNCSTGAITFNSSGGNGSAITYSAPGVTRDNPNSNSGTVEAGLRTDPKSLIITATQGGNSTSYTFNIASFCAAPSNRAPIYNGGIGTSTGTVGRTFYYYVPSGAFTHPDGQVLTYSATGLPTGFLIDPPTGTVYGTISTSGISTVVITATDPGGLSASGQLILGFSPSGGTANNFTLTQPTYNCTTGAIMFTNTGGDGSAITYSAPGITRTGVTSSSGTVEAGLIADPKPIMITATQGGSISVYTFDLVAFCKDGGVNLAPVFSGSLAAATGLTGIPFTYNLPTGAFTDPNAGQSLTYAATGLPTGLSLNAATGAITGTPSATGTNSVVIRATDTGGLSASGTLGLSINANQAPVSTTLVSTTAVAGFPFTYNLPTGAFTDPNTGQTLTYAVIGLPTGLSLNT